MFFLDFAAGLFSRKPPDPSESIIKFFGRMPDKRREHPVGADRETSQNSGSSHFVDRDRGSDMYLSGLDSLNL
jgi:hypothetical protein